MTMTMTVAPRSPQAHASGLSHSLAWVRKQTAERFGTTRWSAIAEREAAIAALCAEKALLDEILFEDLDADPNPVAAVVTALCGAIGRVAAHVPIHGLQLLLADLARSDYPVPVAYAAGWALKQIADRRSQIADRRSQIADRRSQIAISNPPPSQPPSQPPPLPISDPAFPTPHTTPTIEIDLPTQTPEPISTPPPDHYDLGPLPEPEPRRAPMSGDRNGSDARNRAMRRLHAAGAAGGFDHAALRSIGGVESLTSLADDELTALADAISGWGASEIASARSLIAADTIATLKTAWDGMGGALRRVLLGAKNVAKARMEGA